MSTDEIHRRACEAGRLTYTDPDTGFSVFTAVQLERRGRCCGCGCRHCPYGHRNVEGPRPEARDPWIEGTIDGAREGPCDLLFWSGGKDSYLALLALRREHARPIVLLTSFDDDSETVAHQELPLRTITDQARALGHALALVPLRPNREYVDRLRLGVHVVARRRPIARLAFGDLHLEHIRAWRQDALTPIAAEHGASLVFPLWQQPYATLLQTLADAPVTCRVSAIDSRVQGTIAIGDVYDETLVARLPKGVDAFGENGEFHTCVRPHDGAQR